MLWMIIVITATGSGTFNVGQPMNPGSWKTEPECEAALVDEKDFGYTAGWDLRYGENGPSLILKSTNSISVAQCFGLLNY